MSIGANIRKRRFELRMSQQDLANAMGYKTRSTIAKIESGENDITHKKLEKFASVLDTTVEALVTGIAGRISSSAPLTFHKQDSNVDRNKNIVIVLAGGKSVRNHQNIPNQFINIHGKPVLVYCLEAYQQHPAIDDIYVVCLKGWEDIVNAYAEQFGISKLRGLIPAGSSGILSVKNGLDHIKEHYAPEDTLIIQESTRPMVNVDMISKLILACNEKGSATVCQSMRDYVQFSYADGKAEYVNRDALVDLQSPEGHRLELIEKVFETAKKQQHPLTESCCTMLMYNLGYSINFIEGSVNNIKIVRQEDIAIFEALI